ncbi:MAG: hypothetical protein MJ153_02385 [Clostridia bacterium]|nr:hypothetical protein [Clostridia bacterium]
MSKGPEKSKTGARVFVILFDLFVAIWVWLILLGVVLASAGTVCLGGWLLVAGFGAVGTVQFFKAAAILGLIALFFMIIFMAVITIFILKLFVKATGGYLSMHKSMWNEGFTDLEGRA